MFQTIYRRLAFIAALMPFGFGAASAATTPWSPLSLRIAPSARARTANTSRIPARIAQNAASAQAPETILYTFTNFYGGNLPSGQLVKDENGSLYGTLQGGGLIYPTGDTYGGGAVFKLTRTERGYVESVIYRFGESGPNDGDYPWLGSSLAIDRTGALYGSTNVGGSSQSSALCPLGGCGIIYKLTPTPKGYTETVLYNFQGSSDGGDPTTNPIIDRSGALYGTAPYGGGIPGLKTGVVYKLIPTGSGYAYNVIYRFGESGLKDGNQPYGALCLDEKTGDLYGMTYFGGSGSTNENGASGNGIVYKLHPTASGYKYSIIYDFHGFDGDNPISSLIMDPAGALYGTTSAGGTHASPQCASFSCTGVVFKLTPARTGYVETVLHEFTGLDGAAPSQPLVADQSGTLYSTTTYGGQYEYGTVFRLVPTHSAYHEETLHAFNPHADGAFAGGLLLDGGYVLGESGAAYSGPELNGSIFALKL